jgi:hypothetical protein
VGIVVLPSREVAVVLLGMLVRGIFLALGEVASPLVVDRSVARLLALGEVAAMLLLEGLALDLLAGREAAVRGVVAVVVVLAVIVIMIMIVTVIVVGSFAHVPISQAMRVRPLWTAGQDVGGRSRRVAARRLRSLMPTWPASATAVTRSPT